MKKTDPSFKFSFPLQKHFYTDATSSRQSRESNILEFKNGIYQGDLLEYKRHGKGIFLWDIGQVYLGKLYDLLINIFPYSNFIIPLPF